MPVPFNKIVEDNTFGGPRFIPISSDGSVVYITSTDILAAVADDGTGTLQIRRSTDGGSTWNPLAQTFNASGNGWLFEFMGTVYLIQFNNLTPSSTPFEQFDGVQFLAVPSNGFPFAGTNNFVYNVRIIGGLAYIILVEFTQPGPQKNSRIYTWNGTTMTLFHTKNDMEYRDIAQVGTDIVIVGFSDDAVGDFSISTVWDGVSFTDYPSPTFAPKRIIEHDSNHYVLDSPDQGIQPVENKVARINSTNPLSLSAGLTLELLGERVVAVDLLSDGTELYVLARGASAANSGTLPNNPAVYRYSLTSVQLDELSFIFPMGSFVAKQVRPAAETILIMNWNQESSPEVFRLYEYDFSTPTPGTGFAVTETKIIEVGRACSDDAVYLNWQNRLGGRSFWLFDRETDVFEDRFRTRSGGVVVNEVTQLDEDRTNVRQIANSEVFSMRIGVDGLNTNRLKAIIEMFSSPNILMLASPPGTTPIKWIQVTIRDGSFTYSERQTRLQFEIELPQRYLQTN